MASARRRSRASSTYQSLGFEAAVGIDTRPQARPASTRPGRQCAHCASRGRVYMVDTARVRAYLVCPSCAHEWDTGRFEATA